MSGEVKRFPDLAAAAAEADTDLLALKQSAANPDAEPRKWSLAALWAWMLAKITANAAAVRTATGAAPIASPTFTGTPAAPTPALGNSSTLIATMAAVQANAPFKNVALLTASSGTWTPPANVTRIRAIGIGAGGGGGGVGNTAAATASSGAGGVRSTFVMAVTPGVAINYTCGAAGSGGAAGNNPGTDGGDSTFGAATVPGGKGGNASASGNATSPNSTAVLDAQALAMINIPTAGFFVEDYTTGSVGVGSAGVGGRARAAVYGTPGVGGTNGAGGNADGYGAGGGGAGSTSANNFAGGNGSPGCWIIEY